MTRVVAVSAVVTMPVIAMVPIITVVMIWVISVGVTIVIIIWPVPRERESGPPPGAVIRVIIGIRIRVTRIRGVAVIRVAVIVTWIRALLGIRLSRIRRCPTRCRSYCRPGVDCGLRGVL